MESTQEKSPLLDISTGQELVSAYQEITRLSQVTQQYNETSKIFKEGLITLISGSNPESLNLSTDIGKENLAQMGSFALKMFNLEQLIESTSKFRLSLRMALDDVINIDLHGRLVTVRELLPNSYAIEQRTRGRWNGNVRFNDFVPEVTARVGYSIFTDQTLSLYAPTRSGKSTKAEYKVNVVDEKANPLVEIDLQ